MNNYKSMNMLGLCRRAGKLAMGHDMVDQSIKKKRSKLVVITKDASNRIVKELEKTIMFSKQAIKIVIINMTMNDIHFYTGYKAGVMSIEDENFAFRIIELLEQEEIANGYKG